MNDKLTQKQPVPRTSFFIPLLVIMSFMLMIVISSLYVQKMLRDHLRRDAVAELTRTKLDIETKLAEPKSLLAIASNTIRNIIVLGFGPEDVRVFMHDVSVELENKVAASKFVGVFGYFDIFGGEFIHSEGWTSTDTYDTTERTWYKAAVEANGEVAVTPIYWNLRVNDYTIAYSCRIFDDADNPLGVVVIAMSLEHIRNSVANMRLPKDGYGILFDNKLDAVAFPDAKYVGKNAEEINSNVSKVFAKALREEDNLYEYELFNHRDEFAVLFSQRFNNDWVLLVGIPKAEYYKELRDMERLIGSLGIVFAVLLTVFLIRLDIARIKADAQNHEKSLLLSEMTNKREEDERTQIMLDSMPFGANFIDNNGKTITCNEAGARLLGFKSKEEYLENQFSYSIAPEYQPDGRLSKEAARENNQKVLEEGYLRFEWMHQDLKGNPIPCEITLVRINYKNEPMFLAYVHDLREIKQVQDDLRLARDNAEESNKAKSKFLANMSHEIRTPMNAILGIAEIQLQNEALDSSLKEGLEKIYSSGDLLLNIINDILDLSKIEAGKLELIPARYEIASLVNDTVMLNMMRIGSKAIEFSLSVDENMPAALVGDELRIKQILNNLLSNAFKYTKQGVVKLSVSVERGGGLAGGISAGGDNVTLVCNITDTGPGMTGEQVSKLFNNEYARFNVEANRTTEGTGLGMSITYNLVALMNGTISVESQPDKGSMFTVRLPQGTSGYGVLGRELAQRLQKMEVSGNMHLRRAQILFEPMPYGKVLIVDDVESNLYVAKGLMVPYELSIDTLMNGLDAIDKISKGNVYDVIFMDHMMPGMDGIEATQKIRGLGYTQPIVALTANAIVGQAEIFMENGFNDFISKPIDVRQLNAILKKFIRDKQPPEVIEAVQGHRGSQRKFIDAAGQSPLNVQLLEIAARDISKTFSVLESIYKNSSDEDMRMYTISVHGLKSALANIGETELSEAAHKLEQAGRAKDTAAISAQTPLFLDRLRAVMEKLAAEQEVHEKGKATSEEQAYLREKLLALKEACDTYQQRTAKNLLAEIRQKKWPDGAGALLAAIADKLLGGDFEEVKNIAEKILTDIAGGSPGAPGHTAP